MRPWSVQIEERPLSERQHPPVETPPPTDDAFSPLFALDVEDEDTGADSITEPFEPRKIRIETKPLTIDLLLKRIGEGEVDLAPDFQRAAGIWNIGAQSRLIESLLIRIPLPAFYMDATDDDKWVVVDGLQRLTVFNSFILKNAFPLAELEFFSQFNGKRHRELPRPMQRRIAETQVTVYLIQPGTPGEVKFNIFKRINTGGVPLSPQEIRHALNQGPAAVLLRSLAMHAVFLKVAGRSLRDLCEMQPQQKPMMLGDHALQRRDHGRARRFQPALAQIREALRIPFTLDDRLDHRPSTHPHDIADDAGELQVGVLKDLLDAQRVLGDLTHPYWANESH
jgi:hypothetical protein